LHWTKDRLAMLSTALPKTFIILNRLVTDGSINCKNTSSSLGRTSRGKLAGLYGRESQLVNHQPMARTAAEAALVSLPETVSHSFVSMTSRHPALTEATPTAST
jgi:hypothetical protein